MRFLRSLCLLTLASAALADVQFTVPPAGATHRGGEVITAQWKESGNGPRLIELKTYDLYLCAGGDTPDSYEEVDTLMKDAVFARGNSVSFDICPSVGGNEPNAYFLKMVASGRGKSVVNFSPRFSLSHMTGLFSPNVMDGIQSVLGSSEDGGELRRRQAPGAVGGPGVAAAEPTATETGGKFAIPYPQQTGPTRYAPMPEKPGTTIKANSPTPQFPTSPYDIATAYLPPPTIDTTVSAPITYSTSSIENPASPAPLPNAQMKRVLERWQD